MMHARTTLTASLFALPLLTQLASAQTTIYIAHSEQGRTNLSFVDPYGNPRSVDIDIDNGGGTNPTSGGGAPCVADVDDGSFTGTRDQGVTIDDLIYYLYEFEMGFADADIDDGSFTGTPDGGLTIDDLLFFLERFEIGC